MDLLFRFDPGGLSAVDDIEEAQWHGPCKWTIRCPTLLLIFLANKQGLDPKQGFDYRPFVPVYNPAPILVGP